MNGRFNKKIFYYRHLYVSNCYNTTITNNPRLYAIILGPTTNINSLPNWEDPHSYIRKSNNVVSNSTLRNKIYADTVSINDNVNIGKR